MFPDNNTTIYGAVLMVNNKPQGLMLIPPCTQSNDTYVAPPIFLRIAMYIVMILSLRPEETLITNEQ
jgi:hypothetical protein